MMGTYKYQEDSFGDGDYPMPDNWSNKNGSCVKRISDPQPTDAERRGARGDQGFTASE